MRKFKIACAGIFLSILVFSSSVFGIEEDLFGSIDINYSNSYIEWTNLPDEEKEDTLQPRMYTIEIPEKILENYNTGERKSPNIIRDLLLRIDVPNKLDFISASVSDSQYNLKNRINIEVKNQQETSQCWAFSMLSAMETNMALTKGQIMKFSERHMDYATSRTFANGINEKGAAREIGTGGLPVNALAYLTNGQGAVLGSDMPFENNENKINLSEINKKAHTDVTGYAALPSIFKKYSQDGSVEYTNGNEYKYSDTDVKSLRDIIKSYLINHGAIASITAANSTQYYNNSYIQASTAYFCNDSSVTRDHAVTIVGWDDNYSRNNFNQNARPHKDGAYIVLNSYGTDAFNDGYIYISYEDVLIETELYAITDTSEIDYDKLYQHDFYGGAVAIGTTSTDTGYYANIYKRDVSKQEILTHVGVTIPDYVRLEIYINPNGSITSLGSLTKIGETGTLEPGYYKIPVNETRLQGNTFAIVVKQVSENEIFYFSLEGNIPGTVYSVADSEPGQSLISFDGYNWNSVSQLSIDGVDMTKSDVCIKAFANDAEKVTKPDPEPDPDMQVSPYEINGDYIWRINHSTKINDFLGNIVTELGIEIVSENGSIVTNYEELVQTGMILKLSNDREFTLVVRGDLKCDGRITLTDLSQLILHYAEQKGFILTGARIKAADMNFDGKVSIIDISQFLVLYGSIDS